MTEKDKEALQTLKTEWADYKDIWEPMISEEGKAPEEALDFLDSFA